MGRPLLVSSIFLAACCMLFAASFAYALAPVVQLDYEWVARPFYVMEPASVSPYIVGFTPTQIRTAYGLPSTGGANVTIAIVDAYGAPTLQNDLAIFCNQLGLPPMNSTNFEVVTMGAFRPEDSTTLAGWAQETALDVEWAHAIAPEAKILLVQARSSFDDDLMAAVDYARNRPDVVSISLSWGDIEYPGIGIWESYFVSLYGAVFYVASGDDGSGVNWPASSPSVVAVGGTTLTLGADGSVSSETGWSGSGGGVSSYIAKPAYQAAYGTPYVRRAVPDVSYNANPNTGVAVYHNGAWSKVGGTSAGAPQWAAINALGRSANNNNFYQRAMSPINASYLRDILIGSNGYSARQGYDLVTGLGSPLTTNFASITTETDSVTLVPAAQSTVLNSTNRFAVNYLLNGVNQTAFAANGTLTLEKDPGSILRIAGTSIGSTSNEKWVFDAFGTSVTGSNITLTYYDVLAQSVRYGVVGGGASSTPQITYSTAPLATNGAPLQQTMDLALTPQTFWAQRGTNISVTNPLAFTLDERWIASTSFWPSVQVPNQVPQLLNYQHQVQLEVSGASVSTQWHNASTTAQVSVPGISSRASGTGQRAASYSVDGADPVQLQPTTGIATFSVVMDAPHKVQVISKPQYQVTFDSSAAAMLSSITAPTINGDNYWYDEGTQVSIELKGTGTRSGGTGKRVTSYSINGAMSNVATTDSISVFNGPLLSPAAVSATLKTQYRLAMDSGSVASVTAPSISGDPGWYDAGTKVTAKYNYSWNTTQTQRENAKAYSMRQRNAIILPLMADSFRQGNGTFSIEIAMNANSTIVITSVTQYLFEANGGNNVTVSPSSPTRDSFFDAGTEVSASSDYFWSLTNGDTRQKLVSYTLNGATTNFAESESGNNVETSKVVVNAPQQLTFNSVTQYLVSFEFKDNTGSTDITPTSVQIATNNGNMGVQNNQVWLNKGTTFQIQSVIWQGVDSKPNEQTLSTVNGPLSLTVPCQVFKATLSFKNALGFPVSGAPVSVTLANQTTIQTRTDREGHVELGLIPRGTFTAEIKYQDITVNVEGNASKQAITSATAPLTLTDTLPILAAAVISIVVIVVVWMVLRKRRTKP